MRGVTPTSIAMSRISFSPRPSGRFLCTAMRSRMIDFSSLSNAIWTAARRFLALDELLLGGSLGGRRGVLLEDRRLDRLGGLLALELVLHLGGGVELEPRGRRGSTRGHPGPHRSSRRLSSPCPPSAASSRCSAHSFLISAWAMSSASRISASGISFAPASTIRIASSVPATIRSRSSGSRPRRRAGPPRWG